ncbi:MAG TPA: hypothetical protein VK183_08820 [Flavobacterium sp.]|nr:hypothetical protein [Flavobacterium sp.]
MKFFSLVTLLCVFFISCQNPRQELERFVKDYNQSSVQLYEDGDVLSTQAEVRDDNRVGIRIELNIPNTAMEKQYFMNFVPYLADNLANDSYTKPLVDKGVIFELDIMALDKSRIARIVLNKARMDKLIQGLATKKIENPVNPNGIIPGNRVILPELRKSVNVVRRGLPLVDEKEGTTITDIDINADMELEYHITVKEPYASMIDNPGVMQEIKRLVIRNSDLAAIHKLVGVHGIRTMRFKYFDPKHKVLGSFLVSYEELWNRRENNLADPPQ